MKIILIFAFLISSTLSTPTRSETTNYFNELFNFVTRMLKQNDEHLLYPVINKINQNCVREKLQSISEYQIHSIVTAGDAITTAYFLCIDDKYTFWSNNFNENLKKHTKLKYKSEISCLKYALSELEPNSVILEDFNVESQPELSNCNVNELISEFLLETLPMIQFEKCLSEDTKILKVQLLKEIIIANGNVSGEAANAVREDFIRKNIKNNEEFFQCVMNEIKSTYDWRK